jgi:hypothetical protein
MATFKEILGIPEVRTLKQTDFRSRAGDDSGEHQEYDAKGMLLARLEEETFKSGIRRDHGTWVPGAGALRCQAGRA